MFSKPQTSANPSGPTECTLEATPGCKLAYLSARQACVRTQQGSSELQEDTLCLMAAPPVVNALHGSARPRTTCDRVEPVGVHAHWRAVFPRDGGDCGKGSRRTVQGWEGRDGTATLFGRFYAAPYWLRDTAQLGRLGLTAGQRLLASGAGTISSSTPARGLTPGRPHRPHGRAEPIWVWGAVGLHARTYCIL